MQDLTTTELIKKTQSLYKLVILTARRAIELGEGAARLVDGPAEDHLANIALKEIAAGKISYKVKQVEK